MGHQVLVQTRIQRCKHLCLSFVAFLSLFLLPFTHCQCQTNPLQPYYADHQALLDLFASTSGATTWLSTNGWKDGASVNSSASLHHCCWSGIVCSHFDRGINNCTWIDAQVHRVTQIVLSSNRLVGYLPESIGALSEITLLDVSNNILTQNLPNSFSKLTKLRFLYLFNNQFSGLLPSMQSLLSLEVMFLQHNLWSGTLALGQLLPAKVRLVSLADNQLQWIDCSPPSSTSNSSAAPLTATAITPSAAVQFSLSRNNITMDVGKLFRCLLLSTPNVTWFDANFNQISWEGDMTDLNYVSSNGLSFLVKVELSANRLTGRAIDFIQIMFWTGQMLHLDVTSNLLNGSLALQTPGWTSLLLADNPLRANLASTTTSLPSNNNASMTSTTTSSLGFDQDLPVIWPSYITVHATDSQRFDELNLICPLLIGKGLTLSVDSRFVHFQHCRCLDGFVRSPLDKERCIPCPAHVNCSTRMLNPMHKVMQGFYPFPLSIDSYRAASSQLLQATFTPCLVHQVCNPNAASMTDVNTALTQATNTSAAILAISVFECAEGHDPTSFLCSRCLPDYYLWRNQCYSCNSEAYWVVPLCLSMGALAIVCFITYKYASIERAESEMKARAQVMAHRRNVLLASTTTIQVHASSILPIILFWLQAQSVLQVSIPSADNRSTSSGSNGFSNAFARLSLVGTVLLIQPTALECTSSQHFDWQAQFWGLLTAPLWIAVIVAITYVILSNVCERTKTVLPTPANSHNCNQDGKQVFPVPHSIVHLAQAKQEQRPIWVSVCVRLLLSLWSLVYMAVASVVFTSWSCTSVVDEISGQRRRYFTHHPQTECDTLQHKIMIAVGCFIFALFGLGWPLLTFLMTRYKQSQQGMQQRRNIIAATAASEKGTYATTVRKRVVRGRTAEQVDSTCSGRVNAFIGWFTKHLLSEEVISVCVNDASTFLSPSWYAWQLVLPLRKLLLTAMVSLIPRDSSVLPITVLLLLILMALAQSWVRPYKSQKDNIIEPILLLHLTALFLTSILMSSASSMQIQLDQDLATVTASSGSGSSVSSNFLVVDTLQAISNALELIGVILLVGIIVIHLRELLVWKAEEKRMAEWVEKQAGEGNDDDSEEQGSDIEPLPKLNSSPTSINPLSNGIVSMTGNESPVPTAPVSKPTRGLTGSGRRASLVPMFRTRASIITTPPLAAVQIQQPPTTVTANSNNSTESVVLTSPSRDQIHPTQSLHCSNEVEMTDVGSLSAQLSPTTPMRPASSMISESIMTPSSQNPLVPTSPASSPASPADLSAIEFVTQLRAKRHHVARIHAFTPSKSRDPSSPLPSLASTSTAAPTSSPPPASPSL